MALLFIDSFDHYVTADKLKKWTAIVGASDTTTIGTTAGRRSSQGLQCPNGRGLQKYLPAGDATCIVGFAVKPSDLASASEICRIGDDTVQHISLIIKTDGALEVRRGTSSGTILGTSSAGLLTAATYAYVEIKVLINDSTGTVEVRLNGSASPVINLTSQDTQNAGTAAWTNIIVFCGRQSDFDDVYVCDGTGSSPWNTFLGDVRCDVQYANANGNSSGSTPSTGSDRYATVDETTPNSDTDYNTLAASSDKDTLGVQNLVAAGAPILGVQVTLYAKKTDAGVGAVCPVVRHSGSDHDGTSVALSTDYNMVRQMYEVNPGTSAQWAEADFNAAEFGYKRTA